MKKIIVSVLAILFILGVSFSAEPRVIDEQFMDETTSHLDVISQEQQQQASNMELLNNTLLDVAAAQEKWMSDYREEIRRNRDEARTEKILLAILFVMAILISIWHANRTNRQVWAVFQKELANKVDKSVKSHLKQHPKIGKKEAS